VWLLLAWIAFVAAQGQCDFPFPKQYIVYHLQGDESITIDGKLDEPAWQDVSWTDSFEDIQGPDLPKPRFDTFAKMRYDDNYLYIGAYIQEPQVWANITQHDSVIFYDNDFEVFTDPNWSNHFYKEFEMNARNTTWDLYLNKPYLDGGSPTNNWDIKPILTAVYVDGTINDPSVEDKYWSVEIGFPLVSLAYLQNNLTVPPKPGDQWRINFSRVEYHVTVVDGEFQKVPNVPEDNWVWSPQGVVNMHLPERWGFIQFSEEAVNTTEFVPDPYWNLRNVLLQVYYAQKEFESVTGYYAPDLKHLNSLLPDYILAGSCASVPILTCASPNPTSFIVTATQLGNSSVAGYIDDTRLLYVNA